jgi:hypothetical protein
MDWRMATAWMQRRIRQTRMWAEWKYWDLERRAKRRRRAKSRSELESMPKSMPNQKRQSRLQLEFQ